jgi:hypothetical protein
MVDWSMWKYQPENLQFALATHFPVAQSFSDGLALLDFVWRCCYCCYSCLRAFLNLGRYVSKMALNDGSAHKNARDSVSTYTRARPGVEDFHMFNKHQ